VMGDMLATARITLPKSNLDKGRLILVMRTQRLRQYYAGRFSRAKSLRNHTRNRIRARNLADVASFENTQT
jgi:hypothetical protein